MNTNKEQKYKITGSIAINGKSYEVEYLAWATSGKLARLQATNFWRQNPNCSTVQIWNTTIA